MKIVKTLLPLIVIIILFIVSAQVGFGAIGKARKNLSGIEKDIRTLTSKSAVLGDAEETVAEIGSSLSFLFPSQNPAVSVMSQVRSLAAKRSLILTNIKAGGESSDKSGLSKVDISFDVEGTRDSIVGFLADFAGILPITFVDKAKINEIGGVARATIYVKSFWSDLPKKLPGLTENISSLTGEETKILQELLTLTLPAFLDIPAQAGGGSDNPFGAVEAAAVTLQTPAAEQTPEASPAAEPSEPTATPAAGGGGTI